MDFLFFLVHEAIKAKKSVRHGTSKKNAFFFVHLVKARNVALRRKHLG